MPGPAPKPAHLRQRQNRKAGIATLENPTDVVVPDIPNPDGREWHVLTSSWWVKVWESPMSGQYLPTDVDGLGRVALLVDEFYRKPHTAIMAEIRLQEQRFGLSPLDRSRLQWEVKRGEDAERARARAEAPKRTGTNDPRSVLMAVK